MILAKDLTVCLRTAKKKPMNSTLPAFPRTFQTTRKPSCARHLAACCGASSFITTMFTSGLRAIPPVHAWAAWRVYKIERRVRGVADRGFLEKVFHKLLLNFTWWVNRKDPDGANIFQGGFLGLDNIGVFDRSAPLPTGGHLEQSDGTSWMGMYCLNMLAIALELAKEDPAYEDVANKFFEHFVYIAHAMNNLGPDDLALWDEQDGFFYDVLHR